jgi:group I intron endonuclease
MSILHYIYKITNKINQKIYIGQTINPSKRWAGHINQAKQDNPNQIISIAIKKYGQDNFSFEVIASCRSYEDANWAEEELIRQYDCLAFGGKGYNLSLGGEVAPKTDEWKQKVSQTLMGHPVSKETAQKISLANMGHIPWNKGLTGVTVAWNKGIPQTEEVKRKISEISAEKHYSPLTEIKPGTHISSATEIKKGMHLSLDTEIKSGDHFSPSTEFKKGSIPWNRKISPDQKQIIVNDPRSARVLAKEFGVNKTTILNIRKANKQ